MKRQLFSQSFTNWTCADDERIMISQIETHGLDLEDFLANASVSFVDWHGNCTREEWSIDDLSRNDYAKVIQLFSEHLGSIRDRH